ncbi:hypothetical protein NUW54_g11600 [Trametes sanguinea]|uniref:Uncharacterized protein n=1 Tax=Trametes sanguinea TaxID=158606 RepID=A0ACC1NCS7_9APHY|nr:hypothetical protein NUW54_g11600 [Trametes sanguinea]
MNLWFEEVDGQENTYKVVLKADVERHAGALTPEQVTFTFHRPDSDLPDLPVASPQYLRIHAACCQIAYMSGVAEYLERVFPNVDELQGLAHDGASADVLSYALHRLLGAPDYSRCALSPFKYTANTRTLPVHVVTPATDSHQVRTVASRAISKPSPFSCYMLAATLCAPQSRIHEERNPTYATTPLTYRRMPVRTSAPIPGRTQSVPRRWRLVQASTYEAWL